MAGTTGQCHTQIDLLRPPPQGGGGWPCPACTLVNAPECRTCDACGQWHALSGCHSEHRRPVAHSKIAALATTTSQVACSIGNCFDRYRREAFRHVCVKERVYGKPSLPLLTFFFKQMLIFQKRFSTKEHIFKMRF